jgi:D-3-phosphoglycerate dehydrogenase
MATLLEGVEILVVGYEGVSADLLDRAPNLEVIACTRGGPDANVDIDAATERGIPVLYTPGRNADSVADFTFGLLLGVVRHIPRTHHLLRQGVYTGNDEADDVSGGSREDVTWGVGKSAPYAVFKGIELRDRTIGIVGLGAIGQKVAQRAHGFDMDVVAYDPYVDADEMEAQGVKNVDLTTLCRESDIVSVHTTVTDETRGLIGAEEFAAMRDDAYFVNTARASIVDQEALLEALGDDRLAGAALDVFDKEPLPSDHDLFQLDNVVTTPHIAAATRDVIENHSEMIVADLERLLAGRDPNHVANPDAVPAFLERH